MNKRTGLRIDEIIVNLIYWSAIIYIGIQGKFRGLELLLYIAVVFMLYVGILAMLAIEDFIP